VATRPSGTGAVAASKVPGEKLSPTQPFPTRPGPIMPQGYSEDRLIDFTPELRAEAVEIMKHFEKGPLFTPPVVATADIKGTFVYPGFGGGANWNGGAYDPVTNTLYVPIRHRPSAVGLAKTMGVELLNEEEYFELQKLGEFDTKTSSWVATPADIRKLGGALYCDRRYGRVFVGHNGAQSYYCARAFRGSLRV